MIRAVARRAGVAPSQVAIVSGAVARHKLVEIAREDALPLRLCAMTGLPGRQGEQSLTWGDGTTEAAVRHHACSCAWSVRTRRDSLGQI